MEAWIEYLDYLRKENGIYVDENHEFFVCPHCEEAVYIYDEEDNDPDFCPHCHMDIFTD